MPRGPEYFSKGLGSSRHVSTSSFEPRRVSLAAVLSLLPSRTSLASPDPPNGRPKSLQLEADRSDISRLSAQLHGQFHAGTTWLCACLVPPPEGRGRAEAKLFGAPALPPLGPAFPGYHHELGRQKGMFSQSVYFRDCLLFLRVVGRAL